MILRYNERGLDRSLFLPALVGQTKQKASHSRGFGGARDLELGDPLALRYYRLTALVSVNIKIGVVGTPKRNPALGFYCTCKLS